jgi:hypothetical protein
VTCAQSPTVTRLLSCSQLCSTQSEMKKFSEISLKERIAIIIDANRNDRTIVSPSIQSAG